MLGSLSKHRSLYKNETKMHARSYWRKRTVINIIKYCAKQFSLKTTLHGYKFVFLQRRVLLERVIWMILVFSSMITSIFLIFGSEKEFDRRSIMWVTDSINYPIWNYPFPAVTICSFNKISRERALEQAKLLPIKLNHSIEQIADLFNLMGHLYFNNRDIGVSADKRRFFRLMELIDSNKPNLNKLLRNLAPTCSSIVQKCRWKGEHNSCDMIFEKVITSEGHCCSFNYFGRKNHTFGGLRYQLKAPKSSRRVSACGYLTSLEFLLDTSPEDYFSADTLAYGNKIIIHNPYDYPDWTHQLYLSSAQNVVLIGMDPMLTYASPEVRTIPISNRMCYFHDEVSLQNFNIYSYHNCLVECRLNLSIYFCGCIPVKYVNEMDQNDYEHRICSIQDITCLYTYRNYTSSSIPDVGIKLSTRANFAWKLGEYPCNCLPDCNHVDYIFQSSDALLMINHSKATNVYKLYQDIDLVNHSVVRIFFNDLCGDKTVRNVMNNWETFLAFYGSILGLFLGFSIISGIEIIYFFTVKLFTMIWKNYKIKNRLMGKNMAQFFHGKQKWTN